MGALRVTLTLHLLRKSKTEIIVNIQDSIQEKDQKR